MMASYRDPKGKTYPPTDSSLKLLHRGDRVTATYASLRQDPKTGSGAFASALRRERDRQASGEPAEQRRPVEPVTVGLKGFLRVVTPIARSSARSASRE